jgi:MFS family permease
VTGKPRSGPFGIRDFSLLSAGQFASTLGDGCYAIALPWYVLSGHGSAILLGTVLACYGIPRTVLIPVGGVLADRLGHRTTMLIADAARCVLVLLLAALATRHTVSLTALGPIAALMGAGEGLFLPASYAILPSVVDGDQLTAANGYFQALQQAGSLLGPAIGGTVVALASPAPGFAIDSASFAVSAVTLALMKRARTAPEAPADSPQASVGHLLRTEPVLQILLLIVLTANLALGGLSEVALPSLAHLRFGASGFGALSACLAAGSLVGALLATRTAGMNRPAPAATIVFATTGVTMALIPFAGGVAGAAVANTLTGLGIGLGNAMLIPRLQAWAPPELIGRVMSLMMLCALGTFPLSVAVTGVFVRHFGPAPFFPVAGICGGMVFLAALCSRQWRAFGATGPASTEDQAALVTPR